MPVSFLSPSRPGQRLRWRVVPLLGLLGCLALGSQAWAEANLRSSFPGRRVGGGTRGECSARLVANLVPQSNVFAPGASGWLGILQGPSGNPNPLLVVFRPTNGAGVVEPGTPILLSREIGASTASLVLLKAPGLQGPTQWESSYRCGAGSTDPDPLSFVSPASPPAVTLLVKAAEPADQQIQTLLVHLKDHCGGTVAKEQIAKGFALDEVMGSEWPAQLPIRCL